MQCSENDCTALRAMHSVAQRILFILRLGASGFLACGLLLYWLNNFKGSAMKTEEDEEQDDSIVIAAQWRFGGQLAFAVATVLAAMIAALSAL